jgi:hypothetical protein
MSKKDPLRKLLNTIFLPALFSMLFGMQKVYSQTPINKRLRQIITYYEEKADNETLRKAVKDAKTLYKSDVINDSLAKKLLIVDSLLVSDRKLAQGLFCMFTR